MIDIHSHVLWGIDDGAKDIEISSEMLKKAQSDGITDMCVTPHYIYGEVENTASVVSNELAKLRKLSSSLGVKLNLYPGNEIFLSPEIPDLLKAREVMTLNGGRYVLVELPMTMVPGYADDILFEIALMGYTPVLAHPERNREIGEKPVLLEKWKEQGLIFQINSGSITGLFGKNIQRIGLDFIHMGYVGVIASDCHTNRGRSPNLSRARNIINDKFGTEVSELLFEQNSRNILSSKEITNIPKTKSKTIFSFLKVKEAILDYVRA